jgi:hypothetical protein
MQIEAATDTSEFVDNPKLFKVKSLGISLIMVNIGICGIGFMGMIRTGFQFFAQPSSQVLISRPFVIFGNQFSAIMKHYWRKERRKEGVEILSVL